MNETVNEEKARIASKKELSAVEQLLKTVGNLSADEKLKVLFLVALLYSHMDNHFFSISQFLANKYASMCNLINCSITFID